MPCKYSNAHKHPIGGRFDFFSTHYSVVSLTLVRCLPCVLRQLHPTHLVYQLILLFVYTGLRCNVSHQFAYFHFFMWVYCSIHVLVPTMHWCTDEVIWNCDRRSSEEKATYIFTLSSSIVHAFNWAIFDHKLRRVNFNRITSKQWSMAIFFFILFRWNQLILRILLVSIWLCTASVSPLLEGWYKRIFIWIPFK